jgi:hypothetical protein
MIPEPSTLDQEMLFWSLCDDLELSTKEATELLKGKLPRELTAEELGALCSKLMDRLPPPPGDPFDVPRRPQASDITRALQAVSEKARYRVTMTATLLAQSPEHAYGRCQLALAGQAKVAKIDLEMGEPEALNG